jgi:outer membrane lipoprotein-sorting protein
MGKKRLILTTLLFFVAASAQAFTVDELIAKNIAARGGLDKIRAIQSLRTTGKFHVGGGDFSLDIPYRELIRRPGMYRQEVQIQGLTSISAFDGEVGWQVQPFSGRLDPERLSADDAKFLKRQADLDGPLVDYAAKGHRVEYLGTEDVDGTEAHKLKVTFKDGDIQYIYLDPDYFLQIRTVIQGKVRGAEIVQELDWGNFESVNGVMLPFSIEVGAKGRPKETVITVEKVEANVDLDPKLFHFPAAPSAGGR